jgi:hypothetical protein
MPTTSPSRSLSSRLRAAQAGRAPEETIAVDKTPTTARYTRLAQPVGGEETRCTNSVMPGQRCSRMATAGHTLCNSHRAMLGRG